MNESMETETVSSPEQNSKKSGRRILPAVLAVMAAAIVAGAVVFVNTGAGPKSRALLSLAELIEKDPLGLSLELSIDMGEDSYDLEAQARISSADNLSVTQITYSGLALYCADGAVFLEDGTAYRLVSADTSDDSSAEAAEESVSLPDVSALLALIKAYYGDASVSVETDGDTSIYSITLDQETGLALLDILYADAAAAVREMGIITLDLYVADDTAKAIEIAGDASLESGSELDLSVCIDIMDDEDAAFSIPDAVLAALEDGSYADAPALTDELLRLLAAWNALSAQETIAADISFAADFGLFTLSDEFRWTLGEDTSEESSGSDETNGSDAELSVDPEFILEMAYGVFLQGGITFSEDNDSHIYTIHLTSEQIEAIVQELVPDTAELDITYTDGVFEAVVTDDVFTSLSLSCGGSIPVLLIDISVSLDVTVTFVGAADL